MTDRYLFKFVVMNATDSANESQAGEDWDLCFRFPVPDFRPAHDINKLPWWERNVRKDYLKLKFRDVTGSIPTQTSRQCQCVDITSKSLDVFYYETENSLPIHVACAAMDEQGFVCENYGDIQLSFQFYPKKLDEESEEIPNPLAHSCYGVLQMPSEPGPFTAKWVVHESATADSKLPKDNSKSPESEKFVIPGDRVEIANFIKTTIANVEILIDIKLPKVLCHLKSKYIYELLYNRITNDLLLWQPSAPKPTLDPANLYEPSSSFADSKPYFTLQESDSDSDEESYPMTDAFLSAYEKSQYTTTTDQTESTDKPTMKNSQSFCAFKLHVGRGIVTFNTPFRDASTNFVVPERDGEFSLQINKGDMLVVSGYQGDDDLGFVCVETEEASVYHCDMVPCTASEIEHKLPNLNTKPKHLLETLYKSEPGALDNCRDKGDDRKMITVAAKIESICDSQYCKNIQLSVGLNKATLRHWMCREPNTWTSQICDFFNVQNYPLLGYEPKDVLTELHLHLWDCAIDYRPLNLPYRSLLSIGSFSLTSNINTEPNTSSLRFIFQDCEFYLSDKGPPKNGVPSTLPVRLKQDYVNVIDVGLFEITLKTADKKTGKAPFLDMRAFTNRVVIRTCSDSAKVLIELMTYFADDGDLNTVEDNVPEEMSHSRSVSESGSAQLIPVGPIEEQILVTESQQENVKKLLADAMNDIHIDEAAFGRGAELFFFPNKENTVEGEGVSSNPSLQTIQDLGDLCQRCKCPQTKNEDPELVWPNSDDDTAVEDDSYVLVDEKHVGSPEDMFQPSEEIPTPTMRYTLCEMTIIWQIFAGKDFPAPCSQASSVSKKHVKFYEQSKPRSPSTSVRFSAHEQGVRLGKSTTTDKKFEGIDWKLRGGSDRDHSVVMELELSKLRFQHEVYPETEKTASRQTLDIFDVEIRDKLDINISQIHKFLYQFESEALPRRSNTNMVAIKAVHIRPDLRLKAQECCLNISLLPIRLNIDQTALLFIINFFKELGGHEKESTPEGSKQNTPTHHPPIMTVNDIPVVDEDEQQQQNEELRRKAKKAINENLILLTNMEQSKIFANEGNDMEESYAASVDSSVPDDTPIFFRQVVFSPDVFIRVDYNGKHYLDMSQGPITALLLALAQLNRSELRLKRIVYKHGLLGVGKLLNYLVDVWLNDIKRNQLATILGGFGPTDSFIRLVKGIRDLVVLPIQQYRRDGRILRGLRLGANSFTSLTAMAVLELTSRLLYLVQVTAETAFDMLSPGPSISMKRLAKIKNRKKRHHRPQDIRDGLNNACAVVREGINETADNLVNVALTENEHKGIIGAVGGIIRQIPPTILKPVIIGTEATNNVLEAIQCQLAPDVKKEAHQKWKW